MVDGGTEGEVGGAGVFTEGNEVKEEVDGGTAACGEAALPESGLGLGLGLGGDGQLGEPALPELVLRGGWMKSFLYQAWPIPPGLVVE